MASCSWRVGYEEIKVLFCPAFRSNNYAPQTNKKRSNCAFDFKKKTEARLQEKIDSLICIFIYLQSVYNDVSVPLLFTHFL